MRSRLFSLKTAPVHAWLTVFCCVSILAPYLLTGCGQRTTEAPPSRTGLFLSDFHFNPLYDPAIADTIAQAPASQWDSIFATSLKTASASYDNDTNFPLLQSALAAMKKQVPNPDVIFISGDLMVHYFQEIFYNKLVKNPTQAGYVALVYQTEQYIASQLMETFPDAQILPTLGDWDTDTGTTSDPASSTFLSSFASAWEPAVNRHGDAPDFQKTFSTGGYYSTTFPIDLNARLLGLYTQPFAAECTNTACAAAADAELQWLTNQLTDARSKKQRVWLLGHIPPGIDANTTASNAAKPGATCAASVTPFWNNTYATQLYALFTQYSEVLEFGIFAHEHYDDLRLVLNASGNTIFGVKLPPSITPLHNNPAFVQFTYDTSARAITDTVTWYLSNLASTPTAATAVWSREYSFDSTYGQTAFDSKGLTGATTNILQKTAYQSIYINYYPTLYPPGNAVPGMSPFTAWACGLTKLTVADYTACYCDQ